MKKTLCIGLICCAGFLGCVPVRPWQKMYLNDEEMALRERKLQSFESNIEGYREGAAGADGGKSGGGCGCN